MRGLKRQAGGVYGMMFIFATLGGAVLVGMKVLPVYMNESKISNAVSSIAESPTYANASSVKIRKDLGKRFDVNDVKHLKPGQIKLVKSKQGKEMRYEYEVRTNLFSNWDLVLTFKKSYVLGGG